MGQLDALIYKQWILTKRQHVSFYCQILTPLFSILLLWAVIYTVKNTDLTDSLTPSINTNRTFDPEGVIPTYIYPGFIANKYTHGSIPLFNNWNPYRVFRYGMSDKNITSAVNDTLLSPMAQADYVYENYSYTMFNYSRYASGVDANRVLIDDIEAGMSVNIKLHEFDLTIPDGVLLFNKYTNNTGMDVNMQVNNLLKYTYHRSNGITIFLMAKNLTNPHPRDSMAFMVPTEGYIGTMTYLNNKFLKKQTRRNAPTIYSLISMTVDSTAIFGFLDSGIAAICATFIPVALSMGFPLMLYSLVLEKEEKIIGLLQINGLSNRNYWISIYIFYFGLFSVTTTIFSVLGWVFVDSTFFTHVNKFILTIFFVSWNLSQIGFSIFLSILIDTSIYANLIGYLLAVLMTLGFAGTSIAVFSSPSTMPYYFYIIPQCSYVRWFYSIIFDCFSETKCPTGIFDMKGDTRTSFWSLMLSVPMYILLCYLVNNFKMSGKRQSAKKANGDGYTDASRLDVGGLLDDKQSKTVETGIDNIDARDHRYTILSRRLCKIYDNGKVALNDFDIKIPKGKIFGLLGPNGAGKTTFLSILTGALDKTSGEVYFEGKEVVFGERNDARIGFCPQFDILWPSLTVVEHIQFFTKFKNFKPDNMTKYADSLIESIGLSKDKSKRADQLSGGMRRRVSLCNAVTGDPSVIFLDEPSSGLDPIRRREFWELIKKIGVGKAVVLTTHLMEEADVLSDEIGIMMNGEVKAVGTPLALKQKYSSGTKIQLVLESLDAKGDVLVSLRKSFHTLEVTWQFDKTLTINLGSGSDKFRPVFETASRLNSQGLITDWSIMQGSLEEVFLTVVKTDPSPQPRVSALP